MQSFLKFMWELSNLKTVRFILAIVCLALAAHGLVRLINYQNEADFLRGSGEVLLWGGWAAVNIMQPYGVKIPRINFVVNVGLALVISSYFIVG